MGTFDIIGKERRAAWEALGNLTKEEAKEKFSSALLDKAPGFKDFIIEASKQKEIKGREDEERKAKEAVEEEKTRIREEERIKEETQRRAIQDALNKQTFQQFKSYAEQQYPGSYLAIFLLTIECISEAKIMSPHQQCWWGVYN